MAEEVVILAVGVQGEAGNKLRNQGYKVTRLQGYKVTRLQGYRVTGLQGYRVTGLQGYRDNHGLTSTRLKGKYYLEKITEAEKSYHIQFSNISLSD